VTLTVADIDHWSAEAVREVFHAGTARGRATLESLPSTEHAVGLRLVGGRDR
jgi:hypothetical protein